MTLSNHGSVMFHSGYSIWLYHSLLTTQSVCLYDVGIVLVQLQFVKVLLSMSSIMQYN